MRLVKMRRFHAPGPGPAQAAAMVGAELAQQMGLIRIAVAVYGVLNAEAWREKRVLPQALIAHHGAERLGRCAAVALKQAFQLAKA